MLISTSGRLHAWSVSLAIFAATTSNRRLVPPSKPAMGADRSEAEAEAEELFLRIGLTEQTAKCVAFAPPAAAVAYERA